MSGKRYSKLEMFVPVFQDEGSWRSIEGLAAVKEQEFKAHTQEILRRKNESNVRGEVVSRIHPRIRERLGSRPLSVVSRFDERPATGWARKEDLSSLRDFLEFSRKAPQLEEIALNFGLIRLGAASMHIDTNGKTFPTGTLRKSALRRIELAHRKGFLIGNFINAVRQYKGEEITEVPSWIGELKYGAPKNKSLITLVTREISAFSEQSLPSIEMAVSRFVHGVASAKDRRNAREALSAGSDPDMQRWMKLVRKEILKRGGGTPSRDEAMKIILGVMGEDATAVKKEISKRGGRMPSRRELDGIIRSFIGPDAPDPE